MSLEDRLLSRRLIDSSGCWLWTGSCRDNGYGQIKSGKCLLVHRVAAHLWLGFDLESDLFVLHKCDVPRCFNPAHLFFGTNQDNIRDAAAKGRLNTARGEAHGMAQVTEEIVRTVRAERIRTGESYTALGERFGMSRANVHLICARKTWAHVS